MGCATSGEGGGSRDVGPVGAAMAEREQRRVILDGRRSRCTTTSPAYAPYHAPPFFLSLLSLFFSLSLSLLPLSSLSLLSLSLSLSLSPFHSGRRSTYLIHWLRVVSNCEYRTIVLLDVGYYGRERPSAATTSPAPFILPGRLVVVRGSSLLQMGSELAQAISRPYFAVIKPPAVGLWCQENDLVVP